MLFLLLSPLAGCSAEPRDEGGAPPPGTMRIISMTPIASKNLVPNGAFETYWAGAPAPEAFVPPSAKYSTLTRSSDMDGTFSCMQTWSQSDFDLDMGNAFRTHLYGISPNSTFELTVDATNTDGIVAGISLFGIGDDGKTPKPLLPHAIALNTEKGHREKYRVTFQTKDGKRLVIATQGSIEGKEQGRVVWHSFVLAAR